MSIKINWWLRETSWALFLPLKGNWNSSAIIAKRCPGPGGCRRAGLLRPRPPFPNQSLRARGILVLAAKCPHGVRSQQWDRAGCGPGAGGLRPPSAGSCQGERKCGRTLHSDPSSALDTNGLQITIINDRRWDNLPTVMSYCRGCWLYINV